MMINPVSIKNLKSIPASIPASTPLKPSFRGNNDEGDTVEIKGSAPEVEETSEETAGAEEKKPKITADDIRKKSEEFSDTVDAFADNIDKTTDSVTNAATKAAGGITAITAMFSKLIPNSVKEFFAPLADKYIAQVDEAGHAVIKDGKKVMEKVFDETGKVVKTRKPNWAHIGIVAGAVAALTIISAVVKGAKNKAKKAEKAQKA